MPRILKALTIDVTPQRFVEACSPEELIELELELSREEHRAKIREGLGGERGNHDFKGRVVSISKGKAVPAPPCKEYGEAEMHDQNWCHSNGMQTDPLELPPE